MPREEFEVLVGRALDDLPEDFARLLDNVAVTVEDEVSEEVLADLGMGAEEELLGLYQGIPLTVRETGFAGLPDRVVIYRGPILRVCQTRREAMREIRDTVVHELGHHFGLEDDEMPY